MKRKITLSITLAFSIVIVSLMSSATVKAAAFDLSVFGLVTLGPNQTLRITAVNNDRNGNAKIRFAQQSYQQATCNGGVCKYTNSFQNTTDLITLLPGEAASYDIRTTFAVREAVISNNRNVQVSALIINTVTGEVVVCESAEGRSMSLEL